MHGHAYKRLRAYSALNKKAISHSYQDIKNLVNYLPCQLSLGCHRKTSGNDL